MTGLPPHFPASLSHRYRLERELGCGGSATVYLAHDLRHDRPVALLRRIEGRLSLPCYLSTGWLRIDPTFGPLQRDSRFLALLARGS